MEESAAEIRSRTESDDGPPAGVPAKQFLLLQDTAAGTSIAIMLSRARMATARTTRP